MRLHRLFSRMTVAVGTVAGYEGVSPSYEHDRLECGRPTPGSLRALTRWSVLGLVVLGAGVLPSCAGAASVLGRTASQPTPILSAYAGHVVWAKGTDAHLHLVDNYNGHTSKVPLPAGSGWSVTGAAVGPSAGSIPTIAFTACRGETHCGLFVNALGSKRPASSNSVWVGDSGYLGTPALWGDQIVFSGRTRLKTNVSHLYSITIGSQSRRRLVSVGTDKPRGADDLIGPTAAALWNGRALVAWSGPICPDDDISLQRNEVWLVQLQHAGHPVVRSCPGVGPITNLHSVILNAHAARYLYGTGHACIATINRYTGQIHSRIRVAGNVYAIASSGTDAVYIQGHTVYRAHHFPQTTTQQGC